MSGNWFKFCSSSKLEHWLICTLDNSATSPRTMGPESIIAMLDVRIVKLDFIDGQRELYKVRLFSEKYGDRCTGTVAK